MTLLETDKLYYNIRRYWLKKHIGNMPSDTEVWRSHFHQWLESQGCEIVLPNNINPPWVTDSLGVAPGYHKLQFRSDRDATWFTLRWS